MTSLIASTLALIRRYKWLCLPVLIADSLSYGLNMLRLFLTRWIVLWIASGKTSVLGNTTDNLAYRPDIVARALPLTIACTGLVSFFQLLSYCIAFALIVQATVSVQQNGRYCWREAWNACIAYRLRLLRFTVFSSIIIATSLFACEGLPAYFLTKHGLMTSAHWWLTLLIVSFSGFVIAFALVPASLRLASELTSRFLGESEAIGQGRIVSWLLWTASAVVSAIFPWLVQALHLTRHASSPLPNNLLFLGITLVSALPYAVLFVGLTLLPIPSVNGATDATEPDLADGRAIDSPAR